jgi:cell wall-associated NlpC family hydrolase
MYIGDGLLVQAPRTGETVKITPVSAWAGNVAAIRRILPTPAAAAAEGA